MVKKALHHAHRKYRETFTRTDGENEPEDHHVAGVIILLLGIIVLLTGVVYYMYQFSDRQADFVEGYLIIEEDDFSTYSYPIERVELRYGKNLDSVDKVEKFMINNNFEEIVSTDTTVIGSKGSGCYEELFVPGTVCRKYVVSYDLATPESFTVGITRNVLE